jgi:leucyl aminopeptidase (aminopeptidase T)
MGIGVLRQEPITFTVENGLIVKAEGSPAADEMWDILCNYNDKTAFNVAEFGFGLNDAGRMYANNLEALGKFGVGHIGIGSNYAIGGNVKAPCHIDVSFYGLEIYLDNKLVYDKNKIYV